MSDVKSECLPWHFSSDVNQASLIYHAPSGRPRRNMQRHKFRTSTIRKACPARLPRQCNSLLPTLFRSLNLCLGSIVRKEGKSLEDWSQDSNVRIQFVKNFVSPLLRKHEFINRFMEGYSTSPHCQNAQNA